MNGNLVKVYWGQLKNILDANSYGVFIWLAVSYQLLFLLLSTIIDQIRNMLAKQIKKIVMRK